MAFGSEISFVRSDYESRIDIAADRISQFVDAVLGTIAYEATRSSLEKAEKMNRYFAGCARAARAQGTTPARGGERIAAYLGDAFGFDGVGSTDFFEFRAGSNDGFFEFMDWLSNPGTFEPTALRRSLG